MVGQFLLEVNRKDEPSVRRRRRCCRRQNRQKCGRFIPELTALVTTLEALINAAPQGYFANELQRLLHVEVKDALLQLVEPRRVTRQQVTGWFLYCSPEPKVRRRQLLARQALSEIPGCTSAEVSPEELKASLILFSSLLDERQRRLYAGLEWLKLGRGGDQRLAELLQLDPRTVARGRKQLLEQDVEWERVRKPGAGRKPVEKKRPK